MAPPWSQNVTKQLERHFTRAERERVFPLARERENNFTFDARTRR
jgi:hypothetical protein